LIVLRPTSRLSFQRQQIIIDYKILTTCIELVKRDGFKDACEPKIQDSLQDVTKPKYPLQGLYLLLETCQAYRDQHSEDTLMDWYDPYAVWPLGSAYCYLSTRNTDTDKDFVFKQFKFCLRQLENDDGSVGINIVKLNSKINEAPVPIEQLQRLNNGKLRGIPEEDESQEQDQGDDNADGWQAVSQTIKTVQDEMTISKQLAQARKLIGSNKQDPNVKATIESLKKTYEDNKRWRIPDPAVIPDNILMTEDRYNMIKEEQAVQEDLVDSMEWVVPGAMRRSNWLIPQWGLKTDHNIRESITPNEALEVWRILYNEWDPMTKVYFSDTPEEGITPSQTAKLPTFILDCFNDQYGPLHRAMSFLWRKIKNSIGANLDEYQLDEQKDNKRRTGFVVCALKKAKTKEGGKWTEQGVVDWMKDKVRIYRVSDVL